MENHHRPLGSSLLLRAHQHYSYVPRTGENARQATVTVAFAVDFTTAGERLTKREAGHRYIGIEFGSPPEVAAKALAHYLLTKEGPRTLNVAGNGIYTFAQKGIGQAAVNQWVYEVLRRVHEQVGLTSIRSGGQTGVDHAGLVAAVALQVDALGLYPKSFRRRDAEGNEQHATESAVRAEIMAQAQQLLAPRRRYHPDGTLPTQGEIFVFGSNLAGRHGKGAALVARERFGAVPGTGRGRMGQSYGIPTKENGPLDASTGRPSLVTRPLEAVARDIADFVAYAKHNNQEEFFVTRVGCQLAGFEDRQIAILFADAPANCSLPETWAPYLGDHPEEPAAVQEIAEPINIWSGAHGLGGALTNMSELAKSKGCIKHSYPVRVNDMEFPDSESAYQALKLKGNDDYNDGLMIDLISLKLQQNPKILNLVKANGGVAWLEKCSHFTQAKSDRFQAWEGQGYGSRFIRNLIQGYVKAVTGVGPATRVVHVKEAPFDVYIGRAMPGYDESEWANPFKVGTAGQREEVLEQYHEHLQQQPGLLAKVGMLKGKTLGCWCKSRENHDVGCHGDILAALAEGRAWTPPVAAQGSLF